MVGLRMPGELAAGNVLLKVLGGLLLLIGLALLASTENGLLAYRQAAQRHGGEVLDLGSQVGPQSGQYGYMVRVAGPVQVVAAPRARSAPARSRLVHSRTVRPARGQWPVGAGDGVALGHAG